MMKEPIDQKFPAGQLAASQLVDSAMRQHFEFRDFVWDCIRRHQSGDWGDVSPHDQQANDDALTSGARIFSVYLIPAALTIFSSSEKLWVITEADRRITTVLFPSEY